MNLPARLRNCAPLIFGLAAASLGVGALRAQTAARTSVPASADAFVDVTQRLGANFQ